MPRKIFRRLLPAPHKLKGNRFVAWMGASLHHPKLWHVSREGIARGAAIGVFCGFLIPLGQIPLAAVLAFLLHANLPMAIVGTLVTNPFTFPAIYYFAYQLGSFLTSGDQTTAVSPNTFEAAPDQVTDWIGLWSDRLIKLGKPLFTGLVVLACVSASVSYVGISVLWRVMTLREWRQRGWRQKGMRVTHDSIEDRL